MSKWSEVIEKWSTRVAVEEIKMIIKAFPRWKIYYLNKLSFTQLSKQLLSSQGDPSVQKVRRAENKGSCPPRKESRCLTYPRLISCPSCHRLWLEGQSLSLPIKAIPPSSQVCACYTLTPISPLSRPLPSVPWPPSGPQAPLSSALIFIIPCPRRPPVSSLSCASSMADHNHRARQCISAPGPFLASGYSSKSQIN